MQAACLSKKYKYCIHSSLNCPCKIPLPVVNTWFGEFTKESLKYVNCLVLPSNSNKTESFFGNSASVALSADSF